MQIPVGKVIVPPERQRKEFNRIPEMVASIKERIARTPPAPPLINPIVVDTQMNLIAGERRLRACQLIQAENPSVPFYIEARIETPQNEYERFCTELEENILREPLNDQEYAKAIADYHRLKQQHYGKGKPGTGGAVAGWGVRATADQLNISKSTVSSMLFIDRLLQLFPYLKEEATYKGMIKRWKRDKHLELITELAKRQAKNEVVTQIKDRVVLVKDPKDLDSTLPTAVEWLKLCILPHSIDLVLTDVPFGMNVFDGVSMKDSPHGEVWDDDPERVKAFVCDLICQVPRVLKPHSHCFIFCSWEQTFYIKQTALECGMVFEDPPWVWDRGAATASRMPNMSADKRYEMICHLYTGSPVHPESLGPNLVKFTKRSNTVYATQKPQALAEYLIEIGSLPGQTVLDPCFGSGEFLLAALNKGRQIYGCDKNPYALDLFKTRLVSEYHPAVEKPLTEDIFEEEENEDVTDDE